VKRDKGAWVPVYNLQRFELAGIGKKRKVRIKTGLFLQHLGVFCQLERAGERWQYFVSLFLTDMGK
jgi:hypothetical protein